MRILLSTAWPYLHRHRWRLLAGVVALGAMEGAAVSLPLLVREGIAALTGGRPIDAVVVIAALIVASAGAKGLLHFWSRSTFIGLSRDIEYELRDDLFRHLLTLDPRFYGTTRTGDLMSRVTNDLNAVRMMVGAGLMNWLDSCFAFVPAVAVMAATDWQLTLVALVPAPVVSLAVVWTGRIIHRRFERIQRSFADLCSRVQENIAGVRVVRAYAQEEDELAKFARIDAEYVSLNLGLAKVSTAVGPLLQFLIGLTSLLVLWIGGDRLLRGQLTLGDFVMFNTYMAMLARPMVALGRVMTIMQRGTASLGRIRALLAVEPAITAPIAPVAVPARLRGEVALKGVTVDVPGHRALDAIDLQVPAGSTLAIVGPTGSGKSTLVDLIPRLLDPDAGTVRVDLARTDAYAPPDLRCHIGVVPQETFLFSATLAANLKFGVDDVSDERMRWAADVAGLTSDIERFPRGFDTVVGERGISLSGGQKQRTAIARAILRDPSILILDDALSSVDTDTEQRILDRLQAVMRGRTTILITHRASTARRADSIVVLEHGRLVERGTHEQLVTADGYYAALWRSQQLEEQLEAACV